MPRLRTRLEEYLRGPARLWTYSLTPPSRYSCTSASDCNPETSLNPATTMLSTSTARLKPRYGSLRSPVAICSGLPLCRIVQQCVDLRHLAFPSLPLPMIEGHDLLH